MLGTEVRSITFQRSVKMGTAEMHAPIFGNRALSIPLGKNSIEIYDKMIRRFPNLEAEVLMVDLVERVLRVQSGPSSVPTAVIPIEDEHRGDLNELIQSYHQDTIAKLTEMKGRRKKR